MTKLRAVVRLTPCTTGCITHSMLQVLKGIQRQLYVRFGCQGEADTMSEPNDHQSLVLWTWSILDSALPK